MTFFEHLVETNQQVWDQWPVPIDLSNLKEVREAAMVAVLLELASNGRSDLTMEEAVTLILVDQGLLGR
ncbi:hypothetical protein NKH14_17545 [Mesorhizobium sp. M1380]|uniref:hypothetical protein n=1 Tax=Mesorhizobium sp. M1380 TaxID=2957093 RepID=UPI003338ECD5